MDRPWWLAVRVGLDELAAPCGVPFAPFEVAARVGIWYALSSMSDSVILVGARRGGLAGLELAAFEL